MLPQIAGLGPGEIALILAVLVLLFGASKLPELARGSGQALKIFKAETKGLIDSDDTQTKTTRTETAPLAEPVSEPVVVETPREHDVHRG